jgi:transketolase
MIKTNIGFGSPKQDSASAHGEPLGPEATRETKEFFEWPADSPFYVPDEVYDHFASLREQWRGDEAEWRKTLDEFRLAFPQEAERFEQGMQGELPPGWDGSLPSFQPSEGPLATRSASGKVLNALAETLPQLVGGSADLAPSNKTMLDGYNDFGSGQEGARNMHFGVREHAMGAMVNGMALHGGLLPYAGTFLVFADYMRPAIRLAALMNAHSIFIFTHDSIGVGEDGPTHQPIEHLASLRAIPNLTVIRPADANETAAAWRCALESEGPTALILSRQKLPILDPAQHPLSEGAARGAYIVQDVKGIPDVILVATGSELHLALSAAARLAEDGVKARVVSMPSWERFMVQSREYRDRILPPHIGARLALEAGIAMGWRQWVGPKGDIISVERFGASAPGGEVMKQFGFTEENVAARAKEIISG